MYRWSEIFATVTYNEYSRMRHSLLALHDAALYYLFKKKGQKKTDSIGHLSSRDATLPRLRSMHGHAVGWPMCGRLNCTKAWSLWR